MKKVIMSISVLALVASIAYAETATFESVASSRFWGKINIPRLTRAIDDNFDIAEDRLAAIEGNLPTNAVASLTGVLRADDGVVSAAVAGTDYAPVTEGTALLKGDDAGGFDDAVAGVDYLAPGLTFTNSVAATITNLVIVVENGLVTSVTINDETTPNGE